MRIIVDSREKWTQPNSDDTHISDYFDRHGIEWFVRKLDCGDYQIDGDQSVSVDRKKSIDELATNLLNRSDSCRFWREVRRAHAQGTKLIVLCECGGKYHNANDLKYWRSKYSGVQGRRVLEELTRCEYAYGVLFRFCDRRSTARIIIELLMQYSRNNTESNQRGIGHAKDKTKTKHNSGGGVNDRADRTTMDGR